jgi:hypothetical protein
VADVEAEVFLTCNEHGRSISEPIGIKAEGPDAVQQVTKRLAEKLKAR